MSGIEVAVAVQKGMFDTLTATLSAAHIGVYDLVPPDASFPYVTIGDDQALDIGVSCEPDMWEYFSTLHVWSRTSSGRIEAKFVAGLVREALNNLTVTGFNVLLIQCERTDHLRDPDGLSAHSIVTMRFLISIV